MSTKKDLIEQLTLFAKETGRTVRQAALELAQEAAQKENVPAEHAPYTRFKKTALRCLYMILHGKGPGNRNRGQMIADIISARSKRPTNKLLAANLRKLDDLDLRQVMLGVVPFKDRLGLLNEEDTEAVISAIIKAYRALKIQ